MAKSVETLPKCCVLSSVETAELLPLSKASKDGSAVAQALQDAATLPVTTIELTHEPELCAGTYIDNKCPFTGTVSIRGRILTGTKCHHT